MAAVDVTDATFETDVLARSEQVPVVVDLWAEWCGPCRQLGPILEKVVDESAGRVALAKVDVDSNPQVASAFRVQSIPAVYAVKDRQVVTGFVGAQPEGAVREFIDSLLPSAEDDEVAKLVAAGDDASLRRALEIDPANEAAIVALAELLATAPGGGGADEALSLLARIPESAETRRVAALARVGGDAGAVVDDGVETKLDALLDRVKDDEEARREYLDVLELLGPDDPRTATYRRLLTSRLF